MFAVLGVPGLLLLVSGYFMLAALTYLDKVEHIEGEEKERR